MTECDWCGSSTRTIAGKCMACGRELSPMLVFARAGEQGGVELCVQLDGDLHVKQVNAGHARSLIKQLVEAL
jgi:hypothetical protein